MPRRTLSNCVARAQAAADAEEQARWLAEAETLAETDSDWRVVGRAYWERIEDRDAARRCYQNACAADPEQVWCFADLATLIRDAFSDADGAAAALAEAKANLLATAKVPGYRWSQLAGHFQRIAGDDEAARRCLEEGARRAEGIDDLCTMAVGYAELGDRARAARLLERAEACATAEARSTPPRVRGFWTLANAHSALGDTEATRRCMEHGLSLASDVDGCLTMARAWQSRGPDKPDLTLRSLQKAEGLALTPEHWVAIAQSHHEQATDPSGCRASLERAALSASGDALRQVAFGFRHWLGDADKADQLSLPGVAPKAIALRRRPMEGWRSDPQALLHRLLARVDDTALDSIASADYGYRRETNRQALEDIRITGLIPSPMGSTLHEVCALTRWSEGEDTDHVERGLACTLLCLDYLSDHSFTEDITSTLAVLMESCLILGEDFRDAFVGLLVWILEVTHGSADAFTKEWAAEWNGQGDPEAEGPFDNESPDSLATWFALLLTQLRIDPRDGRLHDISRRVVDLERHLSTSPGYLDEGRPWMCRVLCSLRDELWRDLARGSLDAADQVAPGTELVAELRSLVDG